MAENDGIIGNGIIGEELVGGPVAQGTPIGSGTLITVVQKVGEIGSGNLISVEQTVNFRATGLGTFISVEQQIETTGSGTLISVEQVVKDSTVVSREERAGWDGILKVGGQRIPKSQITGIITITRTEGTSSLLNVTLRPPTGVQELTQYQGKTVTFDLQEVSKTTRLYTGIVDIIDIDVNRETLTLRCSNRREELLNSQFVTAKNAIGFYSTLIFSDPEDVQEEVEQRLQTIPSSLDFDGKNQSHLAAWQPKSTPDFVLDDPDVYLARPEIILTERGRLINQININFEYRYDRNYHWQRRWQWESPINDDPCFLLFSGYSRFTREKIQEAADGVGWPMNGTVAFTSIPAAWYECSGNIIGYTPVKRNQTTFKVTDNGGNLVTDSNGNQVYSTEPSVTQSVGRITTDFTEVFAETATWFGTLRWAQTISEQYTVTVKAPQSITQYGLVERDENYGVESLFNSSEWEDYSAYNDLGLGTTYSIDRDTNVSDFNQAWTTALNLSKTTILEGHRDNRVIFSRGIWSDIDLRHTVELTTDPIACKGKVRKIEHFLDIHTTEDITRVEIALSKSIGIQSDSTLALPTRPSDSVTLPSGTIRLDNHFGDEPDPSFTGAIGNRFAKGKETLTQVATQFIVDSPAVPDEFRDQRLLAGTETYNVEIPNDSLTLTFDGLLQD